MTTADLRTLAEALSKTLGARRAEEPFARLFPIALRLLARGEPVTPGEIAAAVGMPQEDVASLIRTLPSVETDEDGNLVGLGLTLRPTPHRFEIEGRRLYTWCALDTLAFPQRLGAAARVESPCRATAEPVRLEVDPEGVRSVEPPEAVLSVVVPDNRCDLRAGFCDEVHFFRSEEAASDWLEEHPGAFVLPVREGFDLGRLLNETSFSGS